MIQQFADQRVELDLKNSLDLGKSLKFLNRESHGKVLQEFWQDHDFDT
jgi:hypothetical protein